MKIGAALPHLLLFGGVRRYIELGNVFTARGWEFTIFTPDGAPPAWMTFAGRVSTLAELASYRPDVMITGTPEYARYLDESAAAVKIFYLQIENAEGEREIVRSGRYRIMVNSSGLASRVRKLYGIEPLDGSGGINPDLFHPPGEGSIPAPVPVSRGERPFRVICYGRISRPRKGTRLVAEAAGSLLGRRRGIELHLFDSYTTGEMDPRIGFDPGFPCRFYLNLPQEGMAAMYGAADLFVSAEKRAGWSNTAAEAAACGLPLVCTKSGTEDFAIDGKNAIVIPRRNVSLLRKAVKRICDEPGLGEAMGRESAEIMKAFTWEKICDRMERDFRKLLEGSCPAPGRGSPGGE